MSRIRSARRQFFVTTPLAVGYNVALPPELSHRLAKVLRLEEGAEIALCDNFSGRYHATLGPKARTATITGHVAPLTATPGPTLWLALPKREAWETALRQATELGAAAIQPVTTRFSQVARFNEERALAILTEAAEQSERLTLPILHPVQDLQDALGTLSGTLWWASETATGTTSASTQPTAVLVGPEGGFSSEENQMLTEHKQVKALSLGPTILRVDTAVVAALALAQKA